MNEVDFLSLQYGKMIIQICVLAVTWVCSCDLSVTYKIYTCMHIWT